MDDLISNSKSSNILRITRLRRSIWVVSISAIIISLIGLLINFFDPSVGAPLKPGLDFTGGTQIKIDRDCKDNCNEINSLKIEKALSNLSFKSESKSPKQISSSIRIQLLDNGQSIVVRLPFLSASQGQEVINAITPIASPIKAGSQSVETIGPTLGGQLLRSSLISLLIAFSGIAFYISLRYDKTFALLALVALMHDVFIVCGIFAWLGILISVEVDSLFAVSLLTIAGYSVNDTVVVFDRIREQNKAINILSLADRIDNAVSATLTRTVFTSGTTLLPLLALIFFGGSTLYWFAISLALGVVIGSWSSIALAPSLLSLKEPISIKTLDDNEETQ